jgi:aspartate/methionine/tyrosine aminotransferase
MAVNATSCTASFVQRAGIAAIEGPQDAVDAMVGEFKKRRNAMVQALNTIPGFRCSLPAGAFYAFPNITGTKMSSKDMADFLLTEAGVACLSGNAFGQHGDGFLRFSYANSLANIMDAIDRIRKVSGRWA